MSQKLVIGIHGLANKPVKDDLAKWWKDAMMEGLARQGHSGDSFEYEMVYWADLLYAQPLHDNSDFDFDPLFNTEPYEAAPETEVFEPYEETMLNSFRIAARDFAG